MLTWETTVALHIDLGRLKKVGTPLVRIGGKPVKAEESVKLSITLGDRNRERTLR